MRTDALFPEGPRLMTDAGQQFVAVPWAEADSLHALLRKRGYPTTLCLNPETRDARLELWPGVAPEAVIAILEARKTAPPVGGVLPAAVTAKELEKPSGSTSEPVADLICI